MKKGKAPVLSAEEAHQPLDSINTNSLIGPRDRALIGLMVYSSARINAVLQMRAALSTAADRQPSRPGTTKLYDRRNDTIPIDKMERIAI